MLRFCSFAETDSIIGEAVSAPINKPLYPNSSSEIMAEEEVAKWVVPEWLRVRGKTSDEGELVEVLEGVPARMSSAA